MAEERLQKILARAGIASRRAAEKLIVEGRVRVNGTVVTRLGSHADGTRDHIRVDGKRIRVATGRNSYYVAFKPQRMITSLSDPEGRPTVADLLRSRRIKTRVFPVGRLDWDADGLLLLTDDGDLAYQVMRPRSHLRKQYRVKVKGHPSERSLERLRRGVILDARRKTRSLPAEIDVEREGDGTTWLRVGLIEGRQNQIKKMFEGVGHPVRRLRRTRLGPLRLGKLKVGEIRPLTQGELDRLRRAVGLESPGGRPGRTSVRA